MNNKKIGYVTFGNDAFGYGIAYCLDQSGLTAQKATIRTARYFDIICFSIFWWEHVYLFYEFCIQAGIGWKQPRPRVIVGGFNTFNPDVFLPYAHQIIVGDGEDVIKRAIDGEFHPSIYTGSEKTIQYNSYDISENDFCYQANTISRIEIARGCKYSCPYCQLSYLKPYREVNFSAIRRAVDKVRSKRVALFAPDGATHKHYKEITELASNRGLANTTSEVRYNELPIFNNTHAPRMGIEGISEKLRRAVRKPITDEDIVELIKLRIKQCERLRVRPAMHTYFILDLPGESQDDWDAFEVLLYKVNDIPGIKDFSWIVTGNVFMPGPHTPFENKSIHLDRDYSRIWKKSIQDKHRSVKFKFSLAGRHTVFSPYSRLLSMIATRGGKEAGTIISNIVSNSQLKRVSKGRWQHSLKILSKFLNNFGGIEQYTGEIEDGPWKKVKIK